MLDRNLGSALQRYGAEFLGTLFLVASGVGTLVIGRFTGVISPLGIAAVFALAFMMVACAIGRLSGSHLNPAVTVAFAVSREFRWRHVPGYVAAQCLGAIAGAALVMALFGRAIEVATTVPFPGALAPALLAELSFSLILMFVIHSVSRRGRIAGPTAAIASGAALLMGVLVAAPLSGGSLNPARSLGTAVVTASWKGHWLYWVAPLLGAVLGALLSKVLRRRPPLLIRRPVRPTPTEEIVVPTPAAEVPSPA